MLLRFLYYYSFPLTERKSLLALYMCKLEVKTLYFFPCNRASNGAPDSTTITQQDMKVLIEALFIAIQSQIGPVGSSGAISTVCMNLHMFFFLKKNTRPFFYLSLFNLLIPLSSFRINQ